MKKINLSLLFVLLNLISGSSHAQLIEMGKQLKKNYQSTFSTSADCKQLTSPDQYKIQVQDKDLSSKEYTVNLSVLENMFGYSYIETKTNQTSIVTVDFYTAYIINFLNEEAVGMQPCDNDKPENKKKCLQALDIVNNDLQQIQKSIQSEYKNSIITNAAYKLQMANIGCAIDLLDSFRTTVKKYK